jgi:p-methyltransferase
MTMEEIASLEDEEDRVDTLLRRGVRVVAISTTWLTGVNAANEVRRAAARIRAIAPDVPIVVGGMGVTKAVKLRRMLDDRTLAGVAPDFVMNNRFLGGAAWRFARRRMAPHFLLLDPRADSVLDALVPGDDAGATLAEIVSRRRQGRDWRDVANMILPEEGGYRETLVVRRCSGLDAETIDWTRFAGELADLEVPVRSGTGCPYRCGFCDFAGLQQLGNRSIESMIAELRTVARAFPAPRHVYFVDDNFGSNRKRLREFTRRLIAEKLNIRWRAFLRADIVDDETAPLMAEAGCYEALLGIESGDPQILANMNKRLKPERALRGIEALDAAGIRTLSTFVIGFPGESARSIERTTAFISSIPSGERSGTFHRFGMFRFILSPLSPVSSREQRAAFGLRGMVERWSHATMNAKEAAAAMRSVFSRVTGPSFVYREQIPRHWQPNATRDVLTARDDLQRHRARGREASLEGLERAVLRAEGRAVMPRRPEAQPVHAVAAT